MCMQGAQLLRLKGLVHRMFQKAKWIAGVSVLCFSVALGGCSGSESKRNANDKEATQLSAEEEYSDNIFAMDTYMSFTAYGVNGKQAVEEGKKEIERLDALWSVSSSDGEVYTLNETGSGKVSQDTLSLLEQAEEISGGTENAFDITIYPLMELWGFTTGNCKVPANKEINYVLDKVDQSQISLEKESGKVTLGKGQKIDFGGIAKGYASNRVMEIWKQAGVTSGMVSLGGNVQVLGRKIDGTPWKVGIRDPESKEGDVLGALQVTDCAVITSGGYERYFEEDGESYHHILDTSTGYPADSGLLSVTIVSEDGTKADALSTALFVMGKEKAISYWREHPKEFEAVLVEEDGTVYITEGLETTFSSEKNYTVVPEKE